MLEDPAIRSAQMELAQLGRLRLASFVEAITLLTLVLVAVPAKHLFGYALATGIIGPVHGIAFLTYAWVVLATISGGGWSRAEIVRLGAAAFLPFGGFLNAGLLRRKANALVAGSVA